MTLLVLSLGMGVLWIFLAPFAQRLFRRAAPLVLAALPAGIFLQLCL